VSVQAHTVPPTRDSSNGTSERLRNYVGGEWIEPAGGEELDVRNPATDQILARVPLSSAEDVDRAVTAAAAAFPAWRATPVLTRARALFALREKLDANREELAQLVTLDMGKTLDDARGEVRRGIESVEAACAISGELKGEVLEQVAGGVDVEMVRQPLGVVAAITPFNFPAMIPLWFLPYAIATGNCFVLKPSERDPLTARRICELVGEIEAIPAGVVNLVNGAHEAVDSLLTHPLVDAVSFVGQTTTARYVASRATEAGKRVQALGGAKNAFVLMPDAEPDAMVAGVLSSAFGAAGQRCLAGSVAIVVGDDAEQEATLARLVAGAEGLQVGAGADPATDVCPLVSPEARIRVEGMVAGALDRGAGLVLDGRREGGEAGAEMGPTIVEPADPADELLREEIFGPVLAIRRAPDLDAAIEIANSSRFGNAAMIFTSSGASMRAFRFGIEAGMLGVNVGVAAPIAWFPFAGWKDSFVGDLHANGRDAFAFYTRAKVVTSRWPSPAPATAGAAS